MTVQAIDHSIPLPSVPPGRASRPRAADTGDAPVRSTRELAFDYVALQLRIDRIATALPMRPTPTFDADALVRNATDALGGPALRAAVDEARARLDIPGDNDGDGWEASTGGRTRRIGLVRRGPEGAYLLVERLLGRLSGEEGRANGRSLARQLSALAEVHPGLDPALVLAVAMRESGAGCVSAERAAVHSFESGGLDHLGSELASLLLPRGFGATWTPEAEGALNHAGRPRLAAWLPADELIVAYGAVLARRWERFEEHVAAVFGADAARMIDALSADGRRAWAQLAFGRPNGAAHAPGSSLGEEFGARTALELLRDEMAAGRSHGLDDLLTHARLRELAPVRRATVTAAEAALLAGALRLRSVGVVG